MKMNALLKGGPMHGEWTEINVVMGERAIEYPESIVLYKFPEIEFKIADALKAISKDVKPEVLHYKLVVSKNQAPLYEHRQRTSCRPR